MKRPLAFVIEDQMNLSILYEDALRLVGYDVKLIRNGLDAVNEIELNEPPTFIVLDVNLPGLSGNDVLKHIRKNPKYANVPVLVATANSVMAKVIHPELSEIDELFIKPVSMIDLQRMAKDVAKKRLELSTQELLKHDTQSTKAVKEVLEKDKSDPIDETLPNRPANFDMLHDANKTDKKKSEPEKTDSEESEAPQ